MFVVVTGAAGKVGSATVEALQATFNVVEAAARWGVRRLVNISSETVPGYVFAERRSRSAARFVEPRSATFPERPDTADYVPVDENHPIRPQDPYALSKYVAELPGHEVMYIEAADNSAGRSLVDLIAAFHDGTVEVRDLPRDDASGISTARAQRMLGWTPARSWRDHLGTDGRPL